MVLNYGVYDSYTSKSLFPLITVIRNLRLLGKDLQLKPKVFEKLVNNRIVDHLKKCGLVSDFQYAFRSSRSTADLLTDVSDRTCRAFNRSRSTRTVALDISKAFNRVSHAGLLHKLKFHGLSGQIFGFIFFFSQ